MEGCLVPILSILKAPKKKKSRRAYLIGQLDRLVSLKVRERDENRCKKCGRTPCYHHHIFTKTRLATRWNLKNGISVCFHCHRWAHAAGEEFRQWVISWMGQKEYDALYITSQMRAGYKEVDLEWMLKDLRRRE